MSIQALQTSILNFRLVGVTGEPAADGHLIHLQMRADYIVPNQTEVPAFQSAGAGHKSQPWHFHSPYAVVLIGSPVRQVGRAVSDWPMHFKPEYGNSPVHFNLDLLLTSAQLDAIERNRNGQELSLTLKIYGDLFDGYRWGYGFDQLLEHVDRDQWITALNDSNYGATLIYEVPLSLSQKDFAKSIDAALMKARRHFLEGNYREAIAACREALEPVKPNNGDLKAARNLLCNSEKKTLTKAQRRILLFAAVKDYTELSHHPTEEGEYLDFTRKEALLVMGATLGLLSTIDEKSA